MYASRQKGWMVLVLAAGVGGVAGGVVVVAVVVVGIFQE